MLGVIVLLAGGCARTPPHEAWTGVVSVESGWRLASLPAVPCDWQGEALVRGGAVLWGELPDRAEGPCPTGSEHVRMVTVDRLGQDGPFLSTVVRARGPEPARSSEGPAPLLPAAATGDRAPGTLSPAAPVDAPFWERVVRTPSRAPGTTTCVTWDLRTGRPARLVDYDAKNAPARWRRATRKAARAHLPAPDPGAFVVGDGHVAFCVPQGTDGTLAWVRVR